MEFLKEEIVALLVCAASKNLCAFDAIKHILIAIINSL